MNRSVAGQNLYHRCRWWRAGSRGTQIVGLEEGTSEEQDRFGGGAETKSPRRLLPKNGSALAGVFDAFRRLDQRMAGEFLAFAGLLEKSLYVVAVRCRKRVLDAPDFLKHQVAGLFRRLKIRRLAHYWSSIVPSFAKSSSGGQITGSMKPAASASLRSLL